VILATELTIQWNEISGVGSIDSTSQTIPLVIGIGVLIRVLYIYYWGDIDGHYRRDHRSRRAPSTVFTEETVADP
jgi:hypothetical protein